MGCFGLGAKLYGGFGIKLGDVMVQGTVHRVVRGLLGVEIPLMASWLTASWILQTRGLPTPFGGLACLVLVICSQAQFNILGS